MSRTLGKNVKVSSKGFTLIELMVSLLVIVVGLLGILLANTYVQKTSSGAYERMVAMQDAQRVIELIRNTSATGKFPSNVMAVFPPGGAVAGFNNLSNQQVTVAYANPNADPLNITVTVSWREHGLRNVSAQLAALMTQRK